MLDWMYIVLHRKWIMENYVCLYNPEIVISTLVDAKTPTECLFI